MLERVRTAVAVLRGASPAPAPARPEAAPDGPAAVTEPETAAGAPVAQRIALDYPVRPRARYGEPYGLPPHRRLLELIAARDERYRAEVGAFLRFSEELARIPELDPAAGEPRWNNGFIPGLDGIALYGYVVLKAPALYLEVGSGHSTTFVRRAIRDHGLSTPIVSIDPHPRAEIDAICDEVVRAPLEDADLSVFERLRPGDILFVDNSHRCFQSSDATVVFTEIVPELPAGVLVGIHDIFLPDDYPPFWLDRYYSEQYLLAAWLLGGAGGAEIVLPSWYVTKTRPQLSAALEPLWPRLAGAERHGGAFWFVTGGR